MNEQYCKTNVEWLFYTVENKKCAQEKVAMLTNNTHSYFFYCVFSLSGFTSILTF